MRVKFCGLTRLDEAQQAAELGAEALGFVFARSPRRVRPAQAATILAGLPAGPERIGVHLRPGPEELRQLADLPLDGLQAEADWMESELDLGGECLLPWMGERFLLPVFHVNEHLLEQIPRLLRKLEAAGTLGSSLGRFVLDRPRTAAGKPDGGVDLRRARAAACLAPMVMAGALTPDNVANRIRVVAPAAVDVSSGIEISRGRKDSTRMRRFISSARRASTSTSNA